MALPSQSLSGGTRPRTPGSSASRPRLWWAWLGLLLLIVAGVAYFAFWRPGNAAPPQAVAPAPDEAPISNLKSPISDPPLQPAPEPAPEPIAPAEPAPQPAIAEPPPPEISNLESQIPAALAAGLTLLEQGKLVEARAALSEVLVNQPEALTPEQGEQLRQQLTAVNDVLIFSKGIDERDPLVSAYVVKEGDSNLSAIARRYKVPYQFIARVNGINPNVIRLGQRLKVVQGPFHLVVHKSAFRMDAFLIDPDGRRIYIRSFKVGLGEEDSTPIGNWTVRPASKLENPRWVNPRTGQDFERDDPANPIGEHWIGLQGADEQTREITGYGIHGTIDPDSVGKQMSMGCIRLLEDDVALVYDMLVEVDSTVKIQR